MDRVAELKDTDIPTILYPTIGFFLPLLEEKKPLIQSITRKTFKYGATDRHKVKPLCKISLKVQGADGHSELPILKLDVYYPPESTVAPNGKYPVFFWVYGGGYRSGARTLPEPADLAYANVGAYYAHKGFITVIPDYRLLPEAKYPDPDIDVRDAIVWAFQNPHSLALGNNIAEVDTDSYFIMGHSAGAVTVSTVFLLSLLPVNIQSRFKGVICTSGAYIFKIEEGDAAGLTTFDPETAALFFGSLEKAQENTPLSLAKAFPKDKVVSLPPFLLVVSEKDPTSFLRASELMQGALESLTGKKVPNVVAKGHNHISINFALTTRQGEEWAEDVIQWMQGLL
ncbi:hypothetical protein D9757_008713 [Collybiopsis confluens]|uniref:BD-FAE-like domain-containing protein n=1 Tax=Collybiopsis confluens TaxID=2823264 RepID=A0A8H5H953_9AGAR|nr:hypothetical protein D9757_008713 [Collybiopsis confluens]